ncbi:heat shock protein 90 [Chryseobacterium taklimakanense]|uniref:Heat shock protein 90 n=1 Tax=Chryseobacterium taklimakanense TaxID=536441 RepID=A0A239WS33_9FLAO|nr:Shedu anti-phage system protein SduA domain-containing protein [Chryseobacterium taklimakanense]SNV36930.1 heat shock protein 90 [Chryseobacterium taklimakanense]
MNKSAHFKIDPKLAELLGETYRSIEEASKELIDNSYDADSENVDIILPDDLTVNPTITIKDNGSGMKEKEVRNEYLNIANSRTSRKGSISYLKKRKVKGRKGIGKFAGLMVATQMKVETFAAGKKTIIVINKDELAKAGYDLEKVPLPISVEDCDENLHGTTITLEGLNQNLNYPNPDRLKELLIRDYGRETDFSITINGENIGVLDLQGKSYSERIELPDGKMATLNYTITEKPVKQAGIVVRVNNKIIGRPQNFLVEDEIIPKKLQNRVYGELICDDLEEDLTADFGAVIDNSKLYQKVTTEATEKLKSSVDEVFVTDMKMARARYQRKINKELEKLPEYKQPFAKKALYKVLEKFYGETEDRINTVISVTVSAMEKDHYWDIIQNIQDTRDGDIEKFADALSEFGLLEMSIVTSQALNRLRFLDELNILVDNPKTLEKTIHKAFENNTWLLGDDYSVIFSDTGMKQAIEKMLHKKYKGDNPDKRPDLLFGRNLSRQLCLIEFKRPSFTLTRDTEKQAIEYRDDLNTYYHNQKIEIILLGGRVKENISSHNEREDVQFRTYIDIIGVARQKLIWLIDELKRQ